MKDYLLLPSGWAVHTVEGDKPTIGTYNPIEKTLLGVPSGAVEDWSSAFLVGAPKNGAAVEEGEEGEKEEKEEKVFRPKYMCTY